MRTLEHDVIKFVLTQTIVHHQKIREFYFLQMKKKCKKLVIFTIFRYILCTSWVALGQSDFFFEIIETSKIHTL